MKNIDVMFQQLKALRDSYNDGKAEDGWWISDTGASMVQYIECPFTCDDMCINEKSEDVSYKSAEWNENCDECKAKWMMSEFTMW